MKIQGYEQKNSKSDESRAKQAYLFLINRGSSMVSDIFKKDSKKKACTISDFPNMVASLECLQTLIEFSGNPKYAFQGPFYASKGTGFDKRKSFTTLSGESMKRFKDNYSYMQRNLTNL